MFTCLLFYLGFPIIFGFARKEKENENNVLMGRGRGIKKSKPCILDSSPESKDWFCTQS